MAFQFDEIYVIAFFYVLTLSIFSANTIVS